MMLLITKTLWTDGGLQKNNYPATTLQAIAKDEGESKRASKALGAADGRV